MTARHTAAEIIRPLKRHGLRFRSFSVGSSGNWTAEDADWNYKDIPHLNQVHSLAWAYGTAIDDDFVASINLQKVAGLQMPIAVTNYDASDGSQVYYTTLFCFILVVETRLSDIPTQDGLSSRGMAQTTYHIGGPRLAMWLFPILKRMLTANYKVLMSEDLPMRERRGQLRRAGFRFVSDGSPRTFAETSDLTVVNVVRPEVDMDDLCAIDLGGLDHEGATVTAGEGPSGLRFVRGSGSEVLVFDRVCSHEGAQLDEAETSNSCLICPWHGKRVRPVATVQIGATETQEFDLDSGCRLTIDKDLCTISGLS